ncbi:MAG: hypothetical protein QOJ79_758 [Actinomycetota bacterium]|jgi:hypothetical protein|nr:hypothetical protein [Actinomycetota bacterium]
MNALITDAERITAKIEGYVLGCQKGDEATLKDVFHADARMFGAVGDTRYDISIVPGMSQAVTDMPTVDHDARILSIDISGDAASVKLAESRFWGQDFVDFFLLNRIDGEWQIVAKSFSHTGESAT